MVGGLVHPVQLAGLPPTTAPSSTGPRRAGRDSQVSLRYIAHDEPLARVLHAQLRAFVSDLAGAALQALLRLLQLVPRRGDAGARHQSRAVRAEHQPAPRLARRSRRARPPGRLYLGTPGSAVAVSLGLGDGLVYRGGELTHFREALPEGHTSTSLFLYYVPEGFAGGSVKIGYRGR